MEEESSCGSDGQWLLSPYRVSGCVSPEAVPGAPEALEAGCRTGQGPRKVAVG